MDIHVQVDGAISVEASHAIGHEVQARLLQSNLRRLENAREEALRESFRLGAAMHDPQLASAELRGVTSF